MKNKIRIYLVVFVCLIPVLHLLSELNTYLMLTWSETTGTYLSSPVGTIINSTQSHTHLFLWPFYIVFLVLLHNGYKEISINEYKIMGGILLLLVIINKAVLYRVFLPSIWWTWANFAILHAVTLIVFAYWKINKETKNV